eukprot:1333292-Lingulodinium_polyedra.AAC.1
MPARRATSRRRVAEGTDGAERHNRPDRQTRRRTDGATRRRPCGVNVRRSPFAHAAAGSGNATL